MSGDVTAMDQAATGFDVLRGLCRDLSLAYAEDQAAAAAATWVRASLGVDAIVTVARPDASGRLRVAWRDGGRLETGRRRSARRKAVFGSMSPARVHLSGEPDRALALFPLVHREASIGVLEVAASDGAIEAAWEILDAISCHLAVALQNLSHHAEIEREIETLRQASRLGSAQRAEQLDMGIAWTAHELRAPLLGLRAVLDLLLLRGTETRELETLRLSLRELDQLVGMSETLLAWASGARPLELRWTDVVRVVEEAAESCRLETGESKILVLAPDHALAWIDPVPVRAAIVNLLRNAVAFAHEGTKVEVNVEDAGDRLVVSVKDEGPEIPAAERRAIFDPFVRGPVSALKRNGSGLGLFIARRVVEAHGGSIWVDSDRAETTFHVLLPIEGSEQQRFAS
jgi:signal transduction histidine kinase